MTATALGSEALDPNVIPSIPPPPGVVPNFVDPEDRSYLVFLAAGICSPLILIFLTLRMYAKYRILESRTWDDYVCVAASLCTVGFFTLILIVDSQGVYGRHGWDVPIAALTNETILLTILFESLYGTVLFLIKLTLFLLYLHIFSHLRWLKYLVCIGIVTTALFYFSMTVVFSTICTPRSGEPYLEAWLSNSCSKAADVSIAAGLFNLLSDIYLLVIPIPAVWGLRLETRKKLGVLVIFATGLTACICGILTVVVRVKLENTADVTWLAVPVFVMTIIEHTIGIMVSCMPAVAAVIRRYQAAPSRLDSSVSGEGLTNLVAVGSKSPQFRCPESQGPSRS